MTGTDPTRIAELIQWLVNGAPGAARAETVVSEVCERMTAAGIPLQRVAVFVRTLHPSIIGVSFIWRPDRPGQPVEVHRAARTIIDDPEYLASPLRPAFEEGKGLRRRLADANCPRDFDILKDFDAEGITDYVVSPLKFLSGENHVVTWTTKAPGGFSDAQAAAIEAVVPPLARLAEIYMLRRTATNLLNVYVGHDAGERILQGHIQRGDTTTLEAVIWLSDLRGFTGLSGRLSPPDLISLLNTTFDAQVPAIETHGGQVLKFMGDGLLAIFPVTAGAEAACTSALEAAEQALAACAVLEAADTPVRIGVGLHVGPLSYGNVGSEMRLDFTCIGPAVNLAARLQGLASSEGWPLVLSEDFARRLARPIRALGDFALKGLTGPTAVFAPG